MGRRLVRCGHDVLSVGLLLPFLEPAGVAWYALVFGVVGAVRRFFCQRKWEMREMLLTVQILASLAMLLIVAGLIQRKRAQQHVRWMLMAFVADIIGLILVEIVPLFDSEKVDPVGGLFADPSMMKGIHATVATLSLVCYVLQIRSGKKILAGDRSLLPKHRTMAGIFLFTRTSAYVTMWML